MGCIRTLLAITVVINHVAPLYGLVFTDAYMAIKIFFIISGFYMSLILNEKYNGPGSYWLFMSNRLLRLFPTYWATLIASVVVSLVFYGLFSSSLLLGPWLTKIHELSARSIALLATANLSIVGQDSLFFTRIDPATGGISFILDAVNQATPSWIYLVIPQAWTLSLEIMFYALAPLLVRRRIAAVACVIAASFAVRAAIGFEGLPFDPWKQRFFPAEIGFFLLGTLSYAIYAKIKTASPPRRLELFILSGYLVFLLTYQFLPGNLVKEFFTYAATVLGLPFIFNYSKKIKWDRMIGELSYPIYIVHWSVIAVTRFFFGTAHLTELAIVFSIAASVALNVFFVNRIELYRQKRVYASS